MGADSHPVYGKFPKDWSIVKLSEITVRNGIQTGPFGSQLHKKDYQPVGTPIITVEHLGDNRILHRDLPRVSDADRKRLSRYWMQTGDIIFSRVGSVDRRALVRDEEDGWLFSGRCLRVRPDTKKVDPSFLSFLMGLEVFKEHIRRIAVGATMPSINTQILSEVDILLPPLAEQRRIAHILGTLDDKIELNRRMNATLEATARALFKSWFVDFDPVHAKAAGRPSGLPPEIDALFPDNFADSELGLVPKGWKVGTIGNITEETNENNSSNEHKMVLSAVNTGELVPSDEYFSKQVYSRNLTKYKVVCPKYFAYNPARVNIGSLGMNRFDTAGLVSPVYKVFKASNDFEIFLDFHFKREEIKLSIAGLASGSVRQNLSYNDLASIALVVAPERIVKKFNELHHRWFHFASSNGRNSYLLEELRNNLLPKLIAGES